MHSVLYFTRSKSMIIVCPSRSHNDIVNSVPPLTMHFKSYYTPTKDKLTTLSTVISPTWLKPSPFIVNVAPPLNNEFNSIL